MHATNSLTGNWIAIPVLTTFVSLGNIAALSFAYKSYPKSPRCALVGNCALSVNLLTRI